MFHKNNKSSRRIQDVEPIKLSRTQVQLFLDCPCCFYLQNKHHVKRPPQFPFTLNLAVDALLKKEFDSYRNTADIHPLIKQYEIDARPVDHPQLKHWRNNFVGIQFLHPKTNLLLYGALDDLWQNSKGEFVVVDYKATAQSEPVTGLNKPWHERYKRQMEFYQWLLRQNGLKVSDTGYFIYCNAKKEEESFSSKLDFDCVVIPYQGNDGWIEETIEKMYTCFNGKTIPTPSPDCDHCNYRLEVENTVKKTNELISSESDSKRRKLG